MILLLSPSKKLRDDAPPLKIDSSKISFRQDTKELLQIMKTKTPSDLKKLMNISDALAELNTHRYKTFRSTFTEKNSRPAILAFLGDVYTGLEAASFKKTDFTFAQKHLRILSGLYGILKPMDLMQDYRLEMGIRLKTERGTNLYHFWGDKLTKFVNKELKNHPSKLIVNLASKEYFSALQKKDLKGEILDIHFREFRDGKYKFLSYNAKRARGMVANFIIKNKITDKESIKAFDYDSYYFNESMSSDYEYFFTKN